MIQEFMESKDVDNSTTQQLDMSLRTCLRCYEDVPGAMECLQLGLRYIIVSTEKPTSRNEVNACLPKSWEIWEAG
jgi:hypothetical protein